VKSFHARRKEKTQRRKEKHRENVVPFSAPLRETSFCLNRSPPGHQIDYQHNHSHHEQQVDKSATDVR